MCTEGRPCEDTGRIWPSVSQGERPQGKQKLSMPGSQTPGFSDSEKSTSIVEAGPPAPFAMAAQRSPGVSVGPTHS